MYWIDHIVNTTPDHGTCHDASVTVKLAREHRIKEKDSSQVDNSSNSNSPNTPQTPETNHDGEWRLRIFAHYSTWQKPLPARIVWILVS